MEREWPALLTDVKRQGTGFYFCILMPKPRKPRKIEKRGGMNEWIWMNESQYRGMLQTIPCCMKTFSFVQARLN